MNTKTITTRKFLILFIVILVFGFTLKVEATSNFTIDSSCNIVFSAHDPNKDDIPLYGGTNAYYLATQTTNDLGYVGTSYPPVLAYLALDDLTSFPHDPTGTLTGSGQMYLTLSDTNGNAYYVRASYVRTGSTCSNIVYDPNGDFSTRIITTTPTGGSTQATSTTFTLGTTGYISDTDFASSTRIVITDYKTNSKYGNQSAILINAWNYAMGLGDGGQFTEYLNSSGSFSISTTTNLSTNEAIGKHTLKIDIITSNLDQTWWNQLWTPDLITIYSTTTTYIIDELSIGDLQQENVEESINDLATSTQAFVNCGIIDFNLANCLYSIFIPTEQQFRNTFQILYDNTLTKFPIGYVTSMVEILKDTTKQDIPVIDLTVPEGIPGAGATLDLTISDVAWIFNATSTFGTPEQKGQSLFSIVNPYWEILVYLSLFLYIASRLLGAYVIEQEVLARREQLNTKREIALSKLNKKK